MARRSARRADWAAGIGEQVELRVTPGAAAEAIEPVRREDGSLGLRIRVTAPAEGGKANAAVLKLLAGALGVPKSALSIIRGQTGRDKVVRIVR